MSQNETVVSKRDFACLKMRQKPSQNETHINIYITISHKEEEEEENGH